VELLVSLAITTIVMTGAYQIFIEGLQLFRTNQAAADAQASVTKAMSLISAELANAAPAVTRNYPTAGPDLPGLTFATPLMDGGAVKYDPVNGDVFWQRYIAFFYEPDPESATGGYNGKIWRGEDDVAEEVAGEPGHRDMMGVVVPFLNANTTNYFQSTSSVRRRMIAEGVSGFEVQIYSGAEFGATAQETAFDITIEAGDKDNRDRDSYYIKVTSRVVPRG
jgi:hypothetical protein